MLTASVCVLVIVVISYCQRLSFAELATDIDDTDDYLYEPTHSPDSTLADTQEMVEDIWMDGGKDAGSDADSQEEGAEEGVAEEGDDDDDVQMHHIVTPSSRRPRASIPQKSMSFSQYPVTPASTTSKSSSSSMKQTTLSSNKRVISTDPAAHVSPRFLHITS